MSNLLAIPFKKTYPIDAREPTRNYIYAHGGGHPDEFKEDIALWESLRNVGVGGVVHVDRIQSALLLVQDSAICVFELNSINSQGIMLNWLQL
jgi:programmed cell death 6-interacting protein